MKIQKRGYRRGISSNKKYAINKRINLENYSNEQIRRWIYSLKAIKRNAEKYKEGDICIFFN